MLKCFRPLSLLKQNFRRRYGTCTCSPADPCDPGTTISILPNGIRIATEFQPTPLACMSLFAEAGSRYETACNNGITQFLEHMAYKGFCSKSQKELEEAVLFMGAKLTAHTSREVQKFTATFSPEYVANVVDILGSIITEMELTNCAIEAEKYNMCLEMVDEDNDPKAVTFDYLHQAAFQGTSLGQRVIGPSKNIRKFDRDFALDFIGRHYQPYKLCIASSGNVNHEDILRLVHAKLGHLFGDAACESDEGPSRFTGAQIMYRDDSMPFAHVAIAVEAPGYTSPDYYTLLVASNIIGEWHRSQGRGLANAPPLAKMAAVDDMCESYESFYIAYREIGLWGVYFVADKMNLDDMVIHVQNKWMKLCMTTQSTEFERAMNWVKLKLAREITGVINSCNDIGTQLMYTCSRKSLEDKFDVLSTIKTSAVRECAERILFDRCPAVAAVGPTENLPDYTRIRAGQYWLRV